MSDYSSDSPPPRREKKEKKSKTEKREKKEKREKHEKKDKKDTRTSKLPKKFFYNVDLPEFVVDGLLKANKADISARDAQLRILMKKKK